MGKLYKNIIALIILGTVVCEGQGIRVSGIVRDSLSGEPLIGANVINTTNKTGTMANNYGFYSIRADNDNTEIVYSFI